MRAVYCLCLCFVLQLSHADSTFDFDSFQNSLTSNVVVSGETYLFIDDTLQLKCKLSDSVLRAGYTAHDVRFDHSQPNKLDDPKPRQCLLPKYVQVMNNSIAVLTVHNVTLDNAGQYVCHVGSNNCLNSKYLGSTTSDVTVEYPPHNVTDFSCTFYNWDQWLFCDWKDPVNYTNLSNINVSTSYSVMSSGLQPCPTETKHSCLWSESEYRGALKIDIQVKVTNNFTNTSATKTFPVNTLQIVKPAPVDQFTIEYPANSPGCLNLTWIHSKIHRDKIYRVQQQSVGFTDTKTLVNNLNATFYQVCNLAPHTHYNFSVEAYPTSPFSGYWSEPFYRDAWTPMTAPDVGPPTTNGSFVTGDCKKGHRNVTIMWQELDKEARNGIIDSYIIKEENGTSLAHVKGTHYSATVNLPCDTSSVLELVAHNEGGESLVPSVLVIPPISASKEYDQLLLSLAVEKVSTSGFSTQNSTLRAQWDVPDSWVDKNQTLTVFWCDRQAAEGCQDQIYWADTAVGEKYLDIPKLQKKAEQYAFGISVSEGDEGWASGIHWTKCLFRRDGQPVPAPHILKIEPKEEAVVVVWKGIECTYDTPQVKPTSYRVKYCEEDRCKSDIKETEVPADISTCTVGNLTPKKGYKFTVQTVSYDTVGEETVPWELAVPIAKETDSTTIYIGVGMGICVALIVIIIAICVYRYCKSSRDRVYKLNKDSQNMFMGNHPPRPPAVPPPNASYQSVSSKSTSGEDAADIRIDYLGMGQMQQVQSCNEEMGNSESTVDSFANNSRQQLIHRAPSDQVASRLPAAPRRREGRPNDGCRQETELSMWSIEADGTSEQATVEERIKDAETIVDPPTNEPKDVEAGSPDYLKMTDIEMAELQNEDMRSSDPESLQTGPESVTSYIQIASSSTESVPQNHPIGTQTPHMDNAQISLNRGNVVNFVYVANHSMLPAIPAGKSQPNVERSAVLDYVSHTVVEQETDGVTSSLNPAADHPPIDSDYLPHSSTPAACGDYQPTIPNSPPASTCSDHAPPDSEIVLLTASSDNTPPTPPPDVAPSPEFSGYVHSMNDIMPLTTSSDHAPPVPDIPPPTGPSGYVDNMPPAAHSDYVSALEEAV